MWFWQFFGLVDHVDSLAILTTEASVLHPSMAADSAVAGFVTWQSAGCELASCRVCGSALRYSDFGRFGVIGWQQGNRSFSGSWVSALRCLRVGSLLKAGIFLDAESLLSSWERSKRQKLAQSSELAKKLGACKNSWELVKIDGSL